MYDVNVYVRSAHATHMWGERNNSGVSLFLPSYLIKGHFVACSYIQELSGVFFLFQLPISSLEYQDHRCAESILCGFWQFKLWSSLLYGQHCYHSLNWEYVVVVSVLDLYFHIYISSKNYWILTFQYSNCTCRIRQWLVVQFVFYSHGNIQNMSDAMALVSKIVRK